MPRPQFRVRYATPWHDLHGGFPERSHYPAVSQDCEQQTYPSDRHTNLLRSLDSRFLTTAVCLATYNGLPRGFPVSPTPWQMPCCRVGQRAAPSRATLIGRKKLDHSFPVGGYAISWSIFAPANPVVGGLVDFFLLLGGNNRSFHVGPMDLQFLLNQRLGHWNCLNRISHAPRRHL